MSEEQTEQPAGPLTAAAQSEYAYKVLSAVALALVVIATVVYRLLEDWSWVDSLYFSVVAVTTVGFGDLTPSTDASKLFTVGYIVSGIAIIGSYLRVTMERRQRRREERSRRQEESEQGDES